MKKFEKNGNVIRHIQSARQWLERAEHAVNSECGTRGELDLILAKAEVQLAQEKRTHAAELSSKVMAFVFRPKRLLFLAMGGLTAGMLLLFNVWPHTAAPGVHTVPIMRPASQAGVPAGATNNQMAIAPQSQDRRENSEMSRGEIKTATDSSEHLPSAAATNVAITRTVSEPAATVQPQLASVSEQEMRMLMRTAERVLRDAK
ncbi:MAG TPA: hypothetical protein VN462_07815 [Negativicutes bacterium]|nr:hypothetical protein [Negativicutes bacterium]